MPRFHCLRVALIALCLAAALPAQTNTFTPPGTTIETLIGPGTVQLGVALDVTRDGRIFVGELGTGRIWTQRAGVTSLVGTVPGIAAGLESGFVGLSADHAWPAQPYLYVYFTTMDASGVRTNVLRRYRVEGDAAAVAHRQLSLGASLDILNGIDAQADTHNGGSMRFGADGTLFVGLGDSGNPCLAQDLTSPHGKILRLNVAALHGVDEVAPDKLRRLLVPANNPFPGPDPTAQLVFALGLRNPFRIAPDLRSGGIVIGDVGANSFEEIDIAFGGENFGWPWMEGAQPHSSCGLGPPPANLTAPAVIIPHAFPENFHVVVPVGGVYRNSVGGRFDLGTTYEPQIFFTDFSSTGPLVRVSYDTATSQWIVAPPIPGQLSTEVWGTIPYLIDSILGPDGAIYFTTLINSYVGRVRPQGTGSHLWPASPLAQAGTAGQAAFQPLVVRVTDEAGGALVGETVVFSITRGGGTITETAVTDASGLATATYTFDVAFGGAEPRVVAWHEASVQPLTFDLTWRGVSSRWITRRGGGSDLELTIRNGRPNGPFAVAWELGAVGAPFHQYAGGSIWTSVLAPTPNLVIFGDGLGALASPANPLLVTDGAGERTIRLHGLPALSGAAFTLQAYAVDALLPYPASVFASNPLPLIVP
ncbi:MAG: PQQ-dependent sugar dehydrogenase [Planctomycetota bacterium]